MINAYAGKSDRGLIRKKNEESWVALPEQGLFIVAEGICGIPGGDIAKKLVVDVLPPLLAQRINDPQALGMSEIILRLKQALCDLSNRLHKESQNKPEYEGMGATVAMALLTEQHVFIAHLGDSRAYMLRGTILQQLTNDHTLVHHLLMTKAIKQDEVENHPGKNQLVQYVGMTMPPNPDVICVPRVKGERLFICSDGLTNMLSKLEITKFLSQFSTPEQICNAMIMAANMAGGRDNITVLLVD